VRKREREREKKRKYDGPASGMREKKNIDGQIRKKEF
jgi:hypothetical protein